MSVCGVSFSRASQYRRGAHVDVWFKCSVHKCDDMRSLCKLLSTLALASSNRRSHDKRRSHRDQNTGRHVIPEAFRC